MPRDPHIVQNQEEVIRFLEAAETHGLREPVRRIDTHGAVVFLAGPDVYKVKRAVRFPFLDYSTLDRRHHACEREIEVNRADAPDLYLGVVPVVRRQGRLHLGGAGDVVEWAVHMRRFDETRTLDRVAVRAALGPDLIRDLAAAVATAHRRAPQRPGVDPVADLRHIIVDNVQGLAETPGLFPSEAVGRLTEMSLDRLEDLAPLLRGRAAEGCVRRCHGDLHLRNIVLIEGRPTLFDAIEFDEALATTDILYDLAFLLMDMLARGLRFEADLLLNRYLVEMGEENLLPALAALPLFLSVRAAIRAKVTAAALPHLDGRAAERAASEARRYFALARMALRPAPPRLVAVGGWSGTGKSTLATRLAPFLGALPGAVHLRSDIERKRLFDVGEFKRLDASAYDAATTRTVYDTLLRKAEIALRAGQAVILDAVHGRPEERAAAAALAERLGVEFTGLWLEAPLPVLIDRVKDRRHDASDADVTVVEAQSRRAAGPIDWHRLDVSASPVEVLERALALVGHAERGGGGEPV